MFKLYKNADWYILRISRDDMLVTDRSSTKYVLKIKEGEFIIGVPTGQIRKAMDNSGDSVVVLHSSSTVSFSSLAVPDKQMDLNVTRLVALLENTVGSAVAVSPPKSCVGKDSKSVVQIDLERERFAGMLNDIKIEGRYKPMPHQLEAAYFKSHHTKAFDLSTMRTGKTGSTMLALEYLFRTQQIKRAMVIAPLSCVRPVWVDAIRATMPRHIVKAVTGSKAQRLKAFEGHADILCTNFDSLKLHPKEWRNFKPDAIVIDECTHYANASSARSKAIKVFISDVAPRYVWGLTGTPGYDPLKAFAMSKLINPDAVACKTLYAWRDLTQYRYGPQTWQWKNRDCAPALIKKALSPAVLFRKEDLFDLPPVVYIARQVEQTAYQKKLMDRLRDEMVAVTETGDQITAQQKSVLVSKLLQCACGAVYTDAGETMVVDNRDRVEEIVGLIEEATGKTVIFSAFTGAIHKLYEDLKERGIKCAVVDGSTSEKKRSEIFRAFQYEQKGQSSVDVLIAHPRTTAFGVELASADMMIFDGAPLSGDFVFGQAVERLSSLKQKAQQITIAQVYSCSEERKVFKALIDGQSQANIVSDLFKSVTSAEI